MVPAAALLPVRLFFGATFLYAGLDKLLDPTFFDPTSPASIHAQMAAFVRTSPIGGLVETALPLAAVIGFVIAIAEIGIGIGALTGLAFRVAAAGGAALSLLFFLTASWATHPYYYGPDLPYAAGWIALAIAGHGDLLVAARFRSDAPVDERALRRGEAPVSPERRALLQTGVLAAAAVIVASLAIPFRTFGRVAPPLPEGSNPPASSATPSASPQGSPGAEPSASGGPAASGGPSASGEPGASASPAASGPADLAVATTADVDRAGAAAFTVPFDAPAPLPAGDPGVVVRLTDGTYVAFDATCTHAGCTVEWDAADVVLFCPCHGAAFDPANGAAVIEGPTDQPLAPLPITVDASTGTISLQA